MQRLLIHPDLMDAIRAGMDVNPPGMDLVDIQELRHALRSPLMGFEYTVTEEAVRIELEILQRDRFCEYDEKDIKWAEPLGLIKVIRHRIPAILMINEFPQFRYSYQLDMPLLKLPSILYTGVTC